MSTIESHSPLNRGLSRKWKSLEIAAWFQMTTNRKWPMTRFELWTLAIFGDLTSKTFKF